MFHLFKSTYLDIQGVAPPSGYRAIFTDVLTIKDISELNSSEKIVYYVPKFQFSKLVTEYIRELFQFATPELIVTIHNQVIARMRYQLAYLSHPNTRNTYIDCNLPQNSIKVFSEITKFRCLFSSEFKRHVGVEWLLCDYFNEGIYADEYQKRFKELLVDNVVCSVKEIKQEMLYKVSNLPKLFPKYDSVEDLFSKEMRVQFLFDPAIDNSTHLISRYNIEDIADLFYSFTKLYNRGYDKARFQEMSLLSLFLEKAYACLRSSNCDQLMQEEIRRDFSIIFPQHRFIHKINCLVIDWVYSMKREGHSDLSLLTL